MKVEYYESGKLKYFEGTGEEWDYILTHIDTQQGEKIIERQPWMKEANWIAKDEDGSVWTYMEKPEIYSDAWAEGEGDYYFEVSGCDTFQFIPWRDSLHRIV